MSLFCSVPWLVDGLAVGPRHVVAASESHPLWIIERGDPSRRQEVRGVFARDLDMHPTGEVVAAGVGQGQVAWITLDGDVAGASHSCCAVNRVRFSPSGRWLAAHRGATLQIWDTATREVVQECDGRHEVTAIDWCGDDDVVVGTKQSTLVFSLSSRTVTARWNTGSVGDICVCSEAQIAVGSASAKDPIRLVTSRFPS